MPFWPRWMSAVQGPILDTRPAQAWVTEQGGCPNLHVVEELAELAEATATDATAINRYLACVQLARCSSVVVSSDACSRLAESLPV